MTSEPKKRGRPATGQTPPAQRTRALVERLRLAGGRRATFNLSADTAADIATIRARGAESDTAAIAAAVHWYARRKLRKPAP
jgi:hypothetical protein